MGQALHGDYICLKFCLHNVHASQTLSKHTLQCIQSLLHTNVTHAHIYKHRYEFLIHIVKYDNNLSCLH